MILLEIDCKLPVVLLNDRVDLSGYDGRGHEVLQKVTLASIHHFLGKENVW